jgi:DNA-directed RNA polymerase subunit delta
VAEFDDDLEDGDEEDDGYVSHKDDSDDLWDSVDEDEDEDEEEDEQVPLDQRVGVEDEEVDEDEAVDIDEVVPLEDEDEGLGRAGADD